MEDLQEQMFLERQRQVKFANKRIEVYGVLEDGSKEFLHSHLGKSAALDYCLSHSKFFPHRFNEYIYGNQQDLEDGTHTKFKRELL